MLNYCINVLEVLSALNTLSTGTKSSFEIILIIIGVKVLGFSLIYDVLLLSIIDYGKVHYLLLLLIIWVLSV